MTLGTLWSGRLVATMAASALLLAGCTGGRAPATPTPTPPSTSESKPMESPSATASAIEFELQPPEPTCPPVSVLRLPPVEGHDYASIDPLLTETQADIGTICEYDLVGLTTEERAMILDDHIRVFAQISVYRSPGDLASFIRRLDDLPLASSDLDDWERAATISSMDRGVLWEGCGNATPCADGVEPTVRTRAVRGTIHARAGNLQFIVSFGFIGEHVPTDVERRFLAIFRDLVLADVANRERA